MSNLMRCSYCGFLMQVPAGSGTQAECPRCGKVVDVPAAGAPVGASGAKPQAAGESAARSHTAYVKTVVDPPGQQYSSAGLAEQPANLVWRRMFEALMDPRSIQWMLMIG